ncbi:hypothetical protein JQK62_20325, partial [Leptospira santarosai]|nr:hypothetical protein [Leptospira santarosai]
MAIILSLLSRYYLKMSIMQKFCTTGFLAAFSTILTYFITNAIASVNLTANMWVQYFIINIIGTLMATLLI